MGNRLRRLGLLTTLVFGGAWSCGGLEDLLGSQCNDITCATGDRTKTYPYCCTGDGQSSTCTLKLGGESCSCTSAPCDWPPEC